ncbi:MAG: hypothetical protein RLZZ627_1393 [Pseudomonadota bacterium]|jgi:uncharacterized protein YqiB (DUF1249 family)
MSSFSPVEKSFWLHRVCEANYLRLHRLVPELEAMASMVTAVPQAPGKPALRFRLLERSPFTLVLEVTHDFEGPFQVLEEPQVRLRVSLDAKTVEMLSDRERPDLHDALGREPPPAQVLEYKWTLNYFLSRWLDHCLEAEYCAT